MAVYSSGSTNLICSVRGALPSQMKPNDFVWEPLGPYTAKTAKPGDADSVITASPVDPAQIKSVTKFRSCAGHVYYGATDFHGQPEGASNMKHYFSDLDSLLTTVNGQPQVQPNTVKLYAPFNGVVLNIFEIGGTGKGIEIERQPFDGWYTTIYHTNPLIHVGATVRSGQLIAYQAGLPTFDMALQRFARELKNVDGAVFALGLESIFAHMTPSVAARWSARGITTATVIVSRADRLAQACTCPISGTPPGPPAPGSTGCYFLPTPADTVPLR